MDIIIIILALFGVYSVWRCFFKPNDFDKLTLINLGLWKFKFKFEQESLFRRVNMASSLVFQSVYLAEKLGSGLNIKEFTASMRAQKAEISNFVTEWLEIINTELTQHISEDDVNKMPAVVAFGLMLLKANNETRFYEVIQNPDQMASALSR
jgi:hypothetical protein